LGRTSRATKGAMRGRCQRRPDAARGRLSPSGNALLPSPRQRLRQPPAEGAGAARWQRGYPGAPGGGLGGLARSAATTVTWRLKSLLDAPVQLASGVFVLRYVSDHEGGTFSAKRLR